jgi:hypothetical protein
MKPRRRYTALRPCALRPYAPHYWRYCWQRSIYLMGRQSTGHADWRRGWRLSPTWKEPAAPPPPPPVWLAALQEAHEPTPWP